MPDRVTTAQDPISAVPPAPAPELPAPPRHVDERELFTNREISWVDFNDRVLQLAEDNTVPLLERLKFAAIYSSNLDEFFMIRVAGVHDQVDAGLTEPGLDGRTPSEVIDAIRQRVVELGARQTHCIEHDLRPALAEHGIRIVPWSDLDDRGRREIDKRFRRQIFPVLTPLAVGHGRPFPYVSNLSTSLIVLVRDPLTSNATFARVKVPTEMLQRFQQLGDSTTFVPLEDVIAAHLDVLFPGMEIIDHGLFRVTRDADFDISDEADDLLAAVETELRRRRFGEIVRVEVDRGMSARLRNQLMEGLLVEKRQVYEVDGLLDPTSLWELIKLPGHSELRDPPWAPVTQPRLQGEETGADVFAAMREGDILVHHPYDSFSTSVERFVEQAVADDDVMAIKMTVYRTSDDTPLVPALIRATERGKQAVCLVELKARFDERANIGWARALEQAGVHVAYGPAGLKTHAKCILVVRREGKGVRQYVHVGTGNYNPTTARLYTDFGLFTCDERIAADVATMFNVLTGYARPQGFDRALVAPTELRNGILQEIEQTIAAHESGKPARIAMKMNALVDKACIDALYAASRVGVPIELNIRGICCLVPGVKDVSENIRVNSVVGRFLEHSRIYAFHRGKEHVVYIGSADLMPRNLDDRVELVVPVDDPVARDDLLDTLERSLADETNSWDLQPDRTWKRHKPGKERRNVQRELMAAHTARAREPKT
jgi:polyphosphate kinase